MICLPFKILIKHHHTLYLHFEKSGDREFLFEIFFIYKLVMLYGGGNG